MTDGWNRGFRETERARRVTRTPLVIPLDEKAKVRDFDKEDGFWYACGPFLSGRAERPGMNRLGDLVVQLMNGIGRPRERSGDVRVGILTEPSLRSRDLCLLGRLQRIKRFPSVRF